MGEGAIFIINVVIVTDVRRSSGLMLSLSLRSLTHTSSLITMEVWRARCSRCCLLYNEFVLIEDFFFEKCKTNNTHLFFGRIAVPPILRRILLDRKIFATRLITFTFAEAGAL